jgi:hypothetical protein
MKSKYTERLNALLDRASSPEMRAELERSLAYAERTKDQFFEDLEKAKRANIREVGTLAGPLKKTKVGKKP